MSDQTVFLAMTNGPHREVRRWRGKKMVTNQSLTRFYVNGEKVSEHKPALHRGDWSSSMWGKAA